MSDRQDPKEIAREICGVFGIGLRDCYRGTMELAITATIQSERDAAAAQIEANQQVTETLAEEIGILQAREKEYSELISKIREELGCDVDDDTLTEVASQQRSMANYIREFGPIRDEYFSLQSREKVLRDALREASAWVPDGSRKTPEQRGAKCHTAFELEGLIFNALSSTPKPESGWRDIESAPKETPKSEASEGKHDQTVR